MVRAARLLRCLWVVGWVEVLLGAVDWSLQDVLYNLLKVLCLYIEEQGDLCLLLLNDALPSSTTSVSLSLSCSLLGS